MLTAVAADDGSIQAWLSQVANLERTGEFRSIRLDRLLRFMPFLPMPPPPCTVTGTKGKGSTVRLIEAALLAAGRRTVAFTSPHVVSVRERWRVDGRVIDAAACAERCTRVAELEVAAGERLTYFERSFAVACLLAAERPGTEFLCEVGLGGRLDCANALDAKVLVMTHLSRDHCAVLGDTLDLIASEKLALARRGRPVVVAPQSAASAAAIRAALPATSPAQWVQRPSQRFDLALLGDHQQDNATAALAAARLCAPDLDERTARGGMAHAQLAARCQLIDQGDRRVLLDGAHNGPSIAATIAVAREHLRPGWRLLIGTARDKEIDEILAVIPYGLRVERVGYTSPRARHAVDWPAPALAWTWHDSIRRALAGQPPGTDLCITGSFYLASETLGALGVKIEAG